MTRRLAAVVTAAALALTLAPHADAAKRKPLRPHGQWVWLTDGIADALAEGVDDPSTIPTSHDGCLMRVTKRWDVTIVCPDGRRIRS